MERFRDSVMQRLRGPDTDTLATKPPPGSGKAIGELIARGGKLTEERIEQILAYQREHGGRFGQAAVALGYATDDDVLRALAKQFKYPVASEEQRRLSPELVMLNEPFSRQAEVFRSIRSQLLVNVFDAQATVRRALAVVSPSSGDGKTYCAANLAISLAQLGGRTLLVDADLRAPRLHEVFNMPNSAGLSGILSGRAERRVVNQVPGVFGLFLLPVGVTPPNPLELVERPAFGLLVHEFTKKFDHVVFDTSAAQYGEDAAVVAARCGAALVVARKHAAKVALLKDLAETLHRCPDTMASVILNEF
jgi:chain length determinant protein tyrosine kinase EpsG